MVIVKHQTDSGQEWEQYSRSVLEAVIALLGQLTETEISWLRTDGIGRKLRQMQQAQIEQQARSEAK